MEGLGEGGKEGENLALGSGSGKAVQISPVWPHLVPDLYKSVQIRR